MSIAKDNIEIIQIKSIKDVIELLATCEYEEKIKRSRSNYLYRGLSSVDYHLITSLERNCKGESGKLEHALLRNFAKYALANHALTDNSVWAQLTIGQHHGLPTRMLDWTYSPLMALHFSVSESSFKCFSDHDSVIWAIHVPEMNELLPEKYREALNKEGAFFFTIDMLNSVTTNLNDYDSDMKTKKAMVLLEPPSIDQRIINQYSYFSIIPQGLGNIEEFLGQNTKKTKKYIIDKNVRWEIRDLLDTLNINERIVYPGLDGVAAWLKRHYYVQ